MSVSQRRVTSPNTVDIAGTELSIWEIIDLREHPDAEARLRLGALDSTRSAIGLAEDIDAPLLIYRPPRAPQVLFVPARRTTADEDDADLERLLGALTELLQDAGEEPGELCVRHLRGCDGIRAWNPNRMRMLILPPTVNRRRGAHHELPTGDHNEDMAVGSVDRSQLRLLLG